VEEKRGVLFLPSRCWQGKRGNRPKDNLSDERGRGKKRRKDRLSNTSGKKGEVKGGRGTLILSTWGGNGMNRSPRRGRRKKPWNVPYTYSHRKERKGKKKKDGEGRDYLLSLSSGALKGVAERRGRENCASTCAVRKKGKGGGDRPLEIPPPLLERGEKGG